MQTGKPFFFQLLQVQRDRERGVPWDVDIPRAHPVNEPPKVKLVYGPNRCINEQHLAAEYGTNWGPNDPRNGKSLMDLRLEAEELPPQYSEH